MKSSELLELLHRHYIKPGQDLPGGIFLHEVGVNGAWGAAGRADAIYAGFTSSSGRLLVGHELKVSRSDWLNELNKPAKADQWADQCHAWWLVVSDPAIVHDGELPHGWGLMSPGTSRTRMKVHQAATVRADHTPSWDAVRSIMARYDTLRAKEINVALANRDKLRNDRWEKNLADAVERRLRDAPESGQAAERLQALEDAIGARVNWDPGNWVPANRIDLEHVSRIGRAALALGGLEAAVRRIANGYSTSREIRRILDEYDKQLAAFGRCADSEADTGEVRTA